MPARFVDDTNLQLRFSLNGDLRQDANTADLIWPVPELVARISEHVTLEPGDVVLTGTPAGVGLSTGTWMQRRRPARRRNHRPRLDRRADRRRPHRQRTELTTP